MLLKAKLSHVDLKISSMPSLGAAFSSFTVCNLSQPTKPSDEKRLYASHSKGLGTAASSLESLARGRHLQARMTQARTQAGLPGHTGPHPQQRGPNRGLCSS